MKTKNKYISRIYENNNCRVFVKYFSKTKNDNFIYIDDRITSRIINCKNFGIKIKKI